MVALTHCPYCALNCGLGLREDGGTVVGIERWKRSPLTRGALCSKGVTAWEQMPHPDRIVRPLVRRRGCGIDMLTGQRNGQGGREHGQRCDQAVPPAAGRSEIDVLRNLTNRLRAGQHLRHTRGRDVFEELRKVSAGGPVDYAGITWQRLRDGDGVFWPCPTEDHPGTPMLHTERFGHADGRARFARVDPKPPPEPTTPSRPLILTTGRVLAHYLSGAQTRRIPAQLAVSPEPVAEVHPATAAACGLTEGQLAQVTNDRGQVVVAWTANPRLRTGTVFLPYHWPVANRLTAADQLDPTSRIPNFKVIPVHVGPVSPPDQPAEELQPLAADSPGESHLHDHTMTARGMA